MQTAPSRALIVIDVQNEYVDGGLVIEYPPVGVALANIGLGMDAAHRNRIPIVVVQNSAPAHAPIFAKGSHGWELHPAVAGRPYTRLIHKTLPSAFPETDLHAWMKANAIDTLAVTGFMTHNCDAATIYEALHQGFNVEFLTDASGAVSYANEAGYVSAADIHRAYSVVFQSRFAATVSTDRWIDAVEARAPLARSTIYASVQAARAQLQARRVA